MGRDQRVAARRTDERSRARHASDRGVVHTGRAETITDVDSDPTRRLWPKPAQSLWPSLVCAKLSQNMSHEQWRDWVAPDIGYSEVCPGLPIPPDDRSD